MNRVRELPLILAVFVGCGDDRTSRTVTGHDATGHAHDDDGPGPVDSGTESVDPVDPGDSESTDSDGPANDTGDGAPGDGDADGGGDGDDNTDASLYSAVAMPGGFDRVIITRTNLEEPSCTRMTLYHPVMFDDFDIVLPAQWSIEDVIAWDSDSCPDDNANPDQFPDAGIGIIGFPEMDALDLYPCVIVIDIDMIVAQNPLTHRIWYIEEVPVGGANCE